jgi:hypothetical protein
MLSRPLSRLLDAIFLRIGGGNHIRADELRARSAGTLLAFIMVSYIPLIVAVIGLAAGRTASVDPITVADQLTAVQAYATRYVDVYLKDPSNSDAIKQFYDGDIPSSALPAGGRALGAASCLAGVVADGYQTYSVLVDAEIPKASHATSMVALKLQVDISADAKNLFRAFTLPHARPPRVAGRSVQLATQTLVSPDRPVFKTVSGFLGALLTGQGDVAPFVAADSTLTAEQPPMFTTLAIERVATNSDVGAAQDVPPRADGVEVTVRAVVQTASGVQLPMDFPLVMSVAGGHWHVDRINDAPGIIAPPDSGLSGDTSTTPPATTTAPQHYPSTTPEGS